MKTKSVPENEPSRILGKHEHKLHLFLSVRLIPLLLLIAVFNICLTIAGGQVNQIVTELDGRILQATTRQISSNLKKDAVHAQEELQAAADVLSGYPSLDGLEALALLQAFQMNSTTSELGILLPNNQLLFSDGASWDVSHRLDFATECNHAPYLSTIYTDPNDPYKKFFYRCTVIQQDNAYAGVLYEFVDLRSLSVGPEGLSFIKNASIFIIDGDTGDYLADSRREPSGNFYTDSANYWDVKLDENLLSDVLASGSEGVISFRSRETGQAFYTYYAPVGISNWITLVFLPIEAAADTAMQIRHILFIVTVTELALFLLYLTWMLVRTYQQNTQKEQQIEVMSVLMDIQQTLFDAHKTPERVASALEKTAAVLTAQNTFLISLIHPEEEMIYVFPAQAASRQKEVHAAAQELIQKEDRFPKGKSILVDMRSRKLRPSGKEQEHLKAKKVESMMLVPIADSEKNMIGILGSVNMQRKWHNTDFLEMIAHNFMMALENISSYQIIEQMGTIDALTGLKNRNSYQLTIAKAGDISGCVYLDANGLHELNNEHGHAAGDTMLQAVSKELQAAFGTSDTYRIGGDEFVALCRNGDSATTSATMQEQARGLCARIDEQGYHVSVGMAWRDTPPSSAVALNSLITEAEQAMYADKRRYYESLGDSERARGIR